MREKNRRYGSSLAASAAARDDEEEDDGGGGGGGGAIGGYRRPKAFKQSSGKSAKIHSKGEKGGVSCYLNGAADPVEQGSNSNIHQHAERLAVAQGLRRAVGNLNLNQNAWPCPPCHAWLRGCANTEQITITVTVTGDQGGYALGHGRALGATGVITYHPDGSFTYG